MHVCACVCVHVCSCLIACCGTFIIFVFINVGNQKQQKKETKLIKPISECLLALRNVLNWVVIVAAPDDAISHS